ncbi:AMP-binding protein [Belliella kenyensis]|uniref:AMP-binding protein n=1 Tax=Belliella kenyensis TaxID=1472724 RepID=A0ABV8EGN1_9BACT|nr:AMP-binding protein [Belliella kenyensis]MCH7401721.1 AMP-binding protein [Belliella kenyensis]MDN3604221.1 AMP-binding protein [Belliella kenyensis]
MGRIILPHRSYSFEQVKAKAWQEIDPYYTSCLTFCEAWLSGEDTFFQQTSGSTGSPKTIEIKRSQMIASALATYEFFKIKKSPKILVCIHTGMIGGKMMLVRGMLWDADIYITPPSSRPFESEWLQSPFDFVAMVPFQVASGIEWDTDLKWLRQIDTLIIGGAASSPELISKIKNQNIKAYQTYGMTETVSHVAVANLQQDSQVYHTLPSVKIGINGAQCLWIEAPMALAHRLQTHDVVELLNGDSFRWLGRADFVINSGGIKIHPELLEQKIDEPIKKTYGNILYFLAGIRDEKLGQKLVLCLETSEDKKKEYILRKELEAMLEKYLVPREIYTTKTFALTDSGKINRQQTLDLCGLS